MDELPPMLPMAGRHLASLERFLADALFQMQDFENALSVYQKQRTVWNEVLQRDPENVETVYNLALVWQHEAECHMFLEDLDTAKTSLDQAVMLLEMYQALSGIEWQSQPDNLGYWDVLAYWHWLKGETEETIRLQALLVEKLRPFAEQNVWLQQQFAESLFLIGLAKAPRYSDKMETADSVDLAELKAAYDDAQATLRQAHDYFQDMERRGVLAPQGEAQRDRVATMQTFLAEMHQKLMATFSDTF